MQLCVLASGSKANSLLLRDNGTTILIDAGLGIRRMLAALTEVGTRPCDLRAIFVTHEHADHTRALNRLQPYANVPVYSSRGTVAKLEERVHHKQKLVPLNGEVIEVGPFAVRAIPVSHDAAEPFAFHILNGRTTISVATDLGEVSPELQGALCDSDCVILESNHDERLLELGPYPQALKDRIRSALGHLSNRQTASALAECRGNGLRHVILAHISEDNNDPALAHRTAEGALDDSQAKIYLTAQQTIGPFLELNTNHSS